MDDIMKSIDLDTEQDLLIANIVKCKPPGNRAPVRDEVSACVPYLHKQIDLIQPSGYSAPGCGCVKTYDSPKR